MRGDTATNSIDINDDDDDEEHTSVLGNKIYDLCRTVPT